MKKDSGAPKRVLWLLNHTTLRECEVPLLENMGLEIFTPKRFPRNSDNRSASVDFDTDRGLTIPESVLEELNAYDFYRCPVNPRIDFLINYYFDSAIVAYVFPMLPQMVSRFKGRILLRAFGLTAESQNYYDFANFIAGPFFERVLMRASDRFWFAAGYPNLAAIEPKFMQERSILLPVGLPQRILSKQNTWRGGDKRIMFVCPDIETYPEAKAVYDEFKEAFGDLPHVICGNQTLPVAYDENVVGRLTAENYERLYQEAEVMFYHSRLPRHLHYHPVEAAAYGMPVVFMNQGMLGSLSGTKQEGGCLTLSEARRKIVSLLTAADPALKATIISDQKKIVQYFDVPHVQAAWKTNFFDEVLNKPIPTQSELRIGILTLDTALESASVAVDLVNALKSLNQSGLSVTVGLDPIQRRHFMERVMSNVSVREIQWTHADKDSLLIAEKLSGFNIEMHNGLYYLPEDNMSRFMDADVWITVGNPATVAVVPLKPTIHVPVIPASKYGSRKLSTKQGAEFNVAANMYHGRAIADLMNVSDFLKSNFAVRTDKILKFCDGVGVDSRQLSLAQEIYQVAGAIA